MSHIANKIHTKNKSLMEVFTGQRYKIDAFQREYRWQRKQMEALLSDLSINFFNSYKEGDTLEDVVGYDCYYMGPIVLCEDGNDKSVVDGQQRLTSFSLLFIFLQHLQQWLEIDEDIFVDFKQYLYISKGGRRTLTLNVPSRNDVMKALMNANQLHEVKIENNIQNDESIDNIIGRYSDILSLFPTELRKTSLLPLFIEWLLNNITIVEIMAYSIDNAYSIFESMNDRGLNLNPTEILKAYLLSKMSDDTKSEEMNDFWKERINSIKTIAGNDADESFFRAWFRAKYAQTSRKTGAGSENEDYENIGTQFHAWLKANQKEIGLKQPQDFYMFVKSDFDFYSDVFMKFVSFQSIPDSHMTQSFYITAQYPLADSLYQPLMLAPINKRDIQSCILEKLRMVNRFVDIYINRRTLMEKSITQSTVRNWMFSVTKNIRNMEQSELEAELRRTLVEQFADGGFNPLAVGFSSSYIHYFYARVLYHLGKYNDFKYLLKSRKQDSLVIAQIFDEDEYPNQVEKYQNFEERRLTNYCLIHRKEAEEFPQIPLKNRISWLYQHNRLPEMNEPDIELEVGEFMDRRMYHLQHLVEEIWNFTSVGLREYHYDQVNHGVTFVL